MGLLTFEDFVWEDEHKLDKFIVFLTEAIIVELLVNG